MQADILDGRPDNGQATRLRREDIDLISTLPHIAEETLNRIGGLNMPMHALRKGIKRKAGARHPPSGCAPLQVSEQHTWL